MHQLIERKFLIAAPEPEHHGSLGRELALADSHQRQRSREALVRDHDSQLHISQFPPVAVAVGVTLVTVLPTMFLLFGVSARAVSEENR